MEDVDELLERQAARAVNVQGRQGGRADPGQGNPRSPQSRGHRLFSPAPSSRPGIGRWTNIALATLPGMIYPSDVAESARYFAPDITTLPVELARAGAGRPLDAPGLGTEPDPVQLARVTTRVLRIGS